MTFPEETVQWFYIYLLEDSKEQYSNAFILGCLKQIPDPRKPYNKRQRFLDIVAITILASLCDADSWDEIED